MKRLFTMAQSPDLKKQRKVFTYAPSFPQLNCKNYKREFGKKWISFLIILYFLPKITDPAFAVFKQQENLKAVLSHETFLM